MLGKAFAPAISEFEGKLKVKLCHDGIFALGKGSDVLEFKHKLEGIDAHDPDRLLPRGLVINPHKCEIIMSI